MSSLSPHNHHDPYDPERFFSGCASVAMISFTFWGSLLLLILVLK